MQCLRIRKWVNDMNENQFRTFRRRICELLNEGGDGRAPLDTEILLDTKTPLHFNRQYFALFYKKSWQSEDCLHSELNPVDWGRIHKDQPCPEQANYYMHVELEYHPTRPNDNMFIRLHLETNRYVVQQKLKDWSKIGDDAEQKKAWLKNFNTMRTDVKQHLSTMPFDEIGWCFTRRGIMQIAKYKEPITLPQNPTDEEINELANEHVSKFKSIFNFLSTKEIEDYLTHQFNTYWPKT